MKKSASEEKLPCWRSLYQNLSYDYSAVVGFTGVDALTVSFFVVGAVFTYDFDAFLDGSSMKPRWRMR